MTREHPCGGERGGGGMAEAIGDKGASMWEREGGMAEAIGDKGASLWGRGGGGVVWRRR